MSALLVVINQMAASGLAALLNTLWYAGAVVGLTWLGLRCLPRVNAATRYWIWTAILGFLIVLPFLPGIVGRARSSLAAREKTMAAVAPLATVPVPPVSIRELAPVTLTVNTAAGSNSWPLWLLAAWMVAAGWQLERLARGLTSVRRLKARAEASSHDTFFVSWVCAVDTQKPTAQSPCRGYHLPVNIRRQVHLMTTAEIASPVAVGYMRPAVIIPPGLLERLEEGERQNVLLHELAHLARYDDWVTLATRALGAVLILHPLAALVLGHIEREREMACDDFVVARTGSARSYARSLARLHDLRWSAGTRLLAAGLFGGGSSLGDRIESLLRRGRKFSAQPSSASLGVSALLLTVLLGAGGLMPSWIAIAQTALPTSFEVASIKLGNPDARNRVLRVWGNGKLSDNYTTMEALIEFAYEIKPEQIEGLPPWAKKQVYTVQAVPPPDTPHVVGLQRNQMVEQMVRSLLADRLRLQVHRLTKQLPVYEIVVAKGGPRLKPISKAYFAVTGTTYHPTDSIVHSKPGRIEALGVSVPALAGGLSRILGRTVIDKTGLTGRYDFTLTWAPWRNEAGGSSGDQGHDGNGGSMAAMAPAPDSSAPSIFTAMEEQLGLKLKPAKGPVEVLVVDHIEPPTPN